MASETNRVVPLTCHGHSRPITHLSFSTLQNATTTKGSSASSYYLISACKDNNPMLRDGTTGDWIGTFIGHKGAVWSSRLSSDASLAITGSADFTARLWDTFTGQCLAVLAHAHIVRAVAIRHDRQEPEGSASPARTRVATGGVEKKLRVWDVADHLSPKSADGVASDAQQQLQPVELVAETATTEISPGAHGATIKSIIWTEQDNILITACDDEKIRWFDISDPSKSALATHDVAGPIGSCEASPGFETDGAESGQILSVAAGKSVYFFNVEQRSLIKRVVLEKDVSAVALCSHSKRFVTGGAGDTWVQVWDYDTERELEMNKGHHGPVWTAAFSPDANLYATGSEDGTIKLWKATKESYGLWR